MGLEEEYRAMSDEKLQEKLNDWDIYTEHEQEILSREIARRKRKESKTEINSKKRNVNKLVLGMIIVVLILGLGTVGYYKVKSKLEPNMPMSEVQAKKRVLEKLEKRYGEEFKIKSFRYIRYTKAYEMEVYPIEDKYMTFKARMHPMNDYSVSDGYLRKSWLLETSRYVKPLIDNISSKSLIMAKPDTDTDELFFKAIDNNWGFKYLKKNYKKNLVLYITIYAFKDITEKNKDELLKSIYKLVKFIKKEGFKTASIEIQFYDEEYFRDKDVVELYNDKRYTFDDRFGEYISKYIFIDSKDEGRKDYVLFSKVTKPKDIEKGIRNSSIYYKNKK